MRKFLVTAILLLICTPAWADERDEVMAGATRCAGIADKRTWLDCFYGSAQPMRAALGLPPAPPAQVRLVPPPGAGYLAPPVAAYASVGKPPPASPSFLREILGTTKPVVANMAVAKYRFYRDSGGFAVTLRDGSVWQQDEADAAANPAHWNVPASALTVTITNGSMGSYNMRVGGEHGPLYKVHPV